MDKCPAGYSSDGEFGCVLCDGADEFESEGECIECNLIGNVLIVVFTVATFAFGSMQLTTSTQLLIFVKILSTFCQCCQLTTLINIEWPSFSLYTIPFTILVIDLSCLTGGIGWNQEHTFYAMIDVPAIATYIL